MTDPEVAVKYLTPDGSFSTTPIENALEVHVFRTPGGESNVLVPPADWDPERASVSDRHAVGYPEAPSDSTPESIAAWKAIISLNCGNPR